MAKYIGNGTTVAFTTHGSTATATVMGGVMSISGPDGDAADVDLTTLDSTSNFTSEKRGFATKGDISMTVAYDPADTGWLKVKAMEASGLTGTCVVSFPSTSLSDETCKAYVKGVGRAIERDTMITRTVTVHPSSDPSWN